uniref:Eukaryotic elongation factor 2 lysine methyltransferase n=1 Tax=Poecilia latipinna TaxID=48699 RepID=A0A3B3USS0_9TELE
MALSEQKERKPEDILRDFRASFFSMNRLASFPWTVSLSRVQSLDVIFVPQPSGDAISLLENVAVISEGTTGLVTWEAALYLAEWALENPQVFTGRSVLELGSGVGLTGITVCRSCSPVRFVFSDCHAAVLEKLRENVRLNGLDCGKSPSVTVDQLDWTTAPEEQIRRIRPDTVIAADVVYDPEVAGSLADLLLKILKCSAVAEILICSTIRNLETYGGFKLRLGEDQDASEPEPSSSPGPVPQNWVEDPKTVLE